MILEQKQFSALRLMLSTRKYLLTMFRDAFGKHGDFIHYQLGSKHSFFVKNPLYVKHILLDKHNNYIKGEQFDAFAPLLGEGVLSVRDHQQWKNQRHTLSSFFHNKFLASYGQQIPDMALQAMEQAKLIATDNQIINVTATFELLAFRIITKTILGLDKEQHAIDIIYEHVNIIFNYLSSRITPLDKLLKFSGGKQCQTSIKFLDEVVFDMIADVENKGKKNGLIASLLLAYQQDKIYESRQHIRDEIMTLFLAGYETVSTLLTWIWILLSRHPEIERQLSNELNTVLNGRLPSYDDLPQLTYTNCVVKEALRLYPPAWIVVRQAVEDDDIGGQVIPKGANIVIIIYFLHQHPDYWENPQGFDPQRFLHEDPELKHIYCPFGMGPRSCLGNSFALMEAQLILATLVQRYRLELLPGFFPEPVPGLTLKPAEKNFMMRLKVK